MADSAITKKALAGALKQLMPEKPFSKISISDICDLCGMNRKSFYYHFQDKYDLINRIFDSEFVDYAQSVNDTPTVLKLLCGYLYTNREFYKRAFRIVGQNSLHSHFCDVVNDYVTRKISADTENALSEMHVRFITDGFVCEIERWVVERDCDSPDEFCRLISSVCAAQREKMN